MLIRAHFFTGAHFYGAHLHSQNVSVKFGDHPRDFPPSLCAQLCYLCFTVCCFWLLFVRSDFLEMREVRKGAGTKSGGVY